MISDVPNYFRDAFLQNVARLETAKGNTMSMKFEAAVRQFTNIPTTQADAFIRNAYDAFKRSNRPLTDETFEYFSIRIDRKGQWVLIVFAGDYEWADVIDPLEIKVMR